MEDVPVSDLKVGDRVLLNGTPSRVIGTQSLEGGLVRVFTDYVHITRYGDYFVTRLNAATAKDSASPLTVYSLAADADGSESLVFEKLDGWPPRLVAKCHANGLAKRIVAALNASEATK